MLPQTRPIPHGLPMDRTRTENGQRSRGTRDPTSAVHFVTLPRTISQRNHAIPIHPQPPPRTPRPLRGSAFGLKGYSCAIPAPHSHTPSSHPTNSTIAETNLNSPNNVFSLPFSLTPQTATRRLSITHPCSSDFPFFGFVNPPRHPAQREIEATKNAAGPNGTTAK